MVSSPKKSKYTAIGRLFRETQFTPIQDAPNASPAPQPWCVAVPHEKSKPLKVIPRRAAVAALQVSVLRMNS
jgi:hypothetical protein